MQHACKILMNSGDGKPGLLHRFHVPTVGDCIFLVYLLISSFFSMLRCDRRMTLPRPDPLHLYSYHQVATVTPHSPVTCGVCCSQPKTGHQYHYSIIINILSPHSRVVNTYWQLHHDMNEPLTMDTNISKFLTVFVLYTLLCLVQAISRIYSTHLYLFQLFHTYHL